MPTKLEKYLLGAMDISPKRSVPPINLYTLLEGDNAFNQTYADGTLDCVYDRLNFAMALNSAPDGWDGDFYVAHVEHATYRQLRGLPFSGRNVVLYRYIGTRNAKTTDYSLVVRCSGQKYAVRNEHGVDVTKDFWSAKERIGVVCGLQCFAELCWSARLVFDNRTPSVEVCAGPKLMDELIRARDIPAGKKRRDRIIHVVQEHKRSTDSGECDVSRHLRGYTDHVCDGCRLVVTPPYSEMLAMKQSDKVRITIEAKRELYAEQAPNN